MRLGNHSGISKSVAAIVVILIVAAGAGVIAYTSEQPKVTLILYSADAYVAEANYLSGGFTNSSGVQVAPPKSAGSTALAQQIASGDPDDIFISVSKSAVGPTYLKTQSPGWAVAFASDQMAIAYSNATLQSSNANKTISDYEAAVSSNTNQSWSAFFVSLTSGGVKVGISDPNSDPAGYRAWIVLGAAGFAYDVGNETAYANALLQNRANSTAASAADLIAPLQAGQVQFLFIYKSAAVSQHLNLMTLPALVNLGSSSEASFYSKFSYKTSTGVETGGPILLFVTVPVESQHTQDSIQFVSYVIKNSQNMSNFGLTVLSPARIYNSTSVPASLAQLVGAGYAEFSGTL